MKYVVLAVVIALVVFYFTRSANNKKVAVENIAIGKDFLAKNKAIEGVTETASGLQYQVLQKGEGTEHPTARSKVKVHYHGSLIDGTVFDSSVERGTPISFGLNQVIRGWTEGVQLMVVGDKFKFFIPAELGYGNRAAGKIAPGSMLIFEVELLEIQ
ncbi:FKBP-type peptidyl-prolyl cis-trans isomerase [Thalassomonas sp. RHCl1]|uniref:FKBP-type peptidyl-prolyl cis-trans isomerase n=1 Tax=Thalassomonas sp. RHCl1 TaxID=2995320 RepID=UPI00248CBF7D|nr:FKBP-type peptidyl-prolyl cis-trans isomerase [Thalassomonas sp. RHCl1]